MYDENNIFAKILKGEAPCEKVFEDNFGLAFKNIAPKANIHILVIPKGQYIDIYDFYKNAPKEFIDGFRKTVFDTIEHLKLKKFRIGANTGEPYQSVFHFHVHILADWYESKF